MAHTVKLGRVNMPRLLRQMRHRTSQVRDLVFVRDEVFSFHEEIATKGVTNFMAAARLGIDEPVVLNHYIQELDGNLVDLNLEREKRKWLLRQLLQASVVPSGTPSKAATRFTASGLFLL